MVINILKRTECKTIGENAGGEKMSRFIKFGMMGAVVCLLTGCGLLPEEEELRTAPVISEYQAEEYRFVLAEKRDLISKEEMACLYQPSKEESLSFEVGGELYSNIYVKAGDEVKKGDLLAELQMGDMDQIIDDSKLAIKKLELQIDYIDHLISAEKKRRTITGDTYEALGTVTNEEAQKNQALDALYIARERLKEKEELKKKRQIYAGMDGIISYVKITKNGDRSIEGEKFIQIMDSSLSFTAKTKNWNYLSVGQKADILVGKDTYETEIASIEKDTDSIYIIKFSLTEPTTNLPQGARGIYTLILEEKKEVLTVPYAAVITIGEKSFVYCMDENDLKTVKMVETGLATDGKIEIKSGLTVGDRVILN
jgi:RND family efflux transporter MFP subunit